MGSERPSAASWVLATRNPGKLRELRNLVGTHGIEAIDLRDAGIAEDPVAEEHIESFDTFEENALAKARYFAARLPGRCVVADDSGLVVEALLGEPGVRSKRWSGVAGADAQVVDAANNTKLMARLAGVTHRTARFVCAAAWSDGANEIVVTGALPGRIVDEPSGLNGFGYDPHFFVDELGMTLADATIVDKAAVSHRGRAFAGLVAALRARGTL